MGVLALGTTWRSGIAMLRVRYSGEVPPAGRFPQERTLACTHGRCPDELAIQRLSVGGDDL